MIYRATPRCNLVVDSCCDLPRELLEEAGVEILEFPYIMDDGEHLDDMGRSLTPKEFYQKMRDGVQPTTAQIPLSEFVEMFTRIADSGIPTVYLAFTAALSGSFNTASTILSQVLESHPDAEIYLVDTLLASVAEGLLALGAIRQRDRGLTAAQLAEWAQEARYYVHGYFTLATLDALKRGGRIPAMAANVGAKLDIKPILSFDLDGNLTSHSMVRGRKKALKALIDLFSQRATDASRTSIIIASADSERDGDFIEDRASKVTELHHVVRASIGPVIGSHVGPGMLAIVFWGPDRREDISIADRIANSVRTAMPGSVGNNGIDPSSTPAASRIALEASDNSETSCEVSQGDIIVTFVDSVSSDRLGTAVIDAIPDTPAAVADSSRSSSDDPQVH
jgi:DegV family protein with EDD domain